jgi:hypothetical protein
MKTPKDWSEITIDKFNELEELKKVSFDSIFDFQISRLAILTDKDEEEIEEEIEDVEQLTQLTQKTRWIEKGVIPRKTAEDFEGFKFKGFKDLRLGEFIDLERTFAKDFRENAAKILAILYRKTKAGEWGELVIEPYRAVNVAERTEIFKSAPVDLAERVIRDYLEFRENFIKKRKPLFEGEDEDEEDEMDNEESEELENLTIEEAKKEKQKEALKKWSWEVFIYRLCNKDLTKFEEVTDLKLTLVFNFETMLNEVKLEE